MRQHKLIGTKAAQELASHIRKHDAKELLRRHQQGLGRPIISTEFKGQRMVVVADKMFGSDTWKTFPDFLNWYLRHALGDEFFDTEQSKPFEDQHPLIQWCTLYIEHRKKYRSPQGGLSHAPAHGVAKCVLGTAYNLYLLKHNVELQERLIKRLRDPKNFQGAYYELIVAGTLITNGFRLELEDESDESKKHCEFSAISQTTNKKFWIEAKMRSVQGYFGKTAVDAGSASEKDPTKQMTKQLNEALAKPADSDRLVFIDINHVPSNGDLNPPWVLKAEKRLHAKEQQESGGKQAFVFVTNFAFHRGLDQDVPSEVFAYGLNIPIFGKQGIFQLKDLIRAKREQEDAHRIPEALSQYPVIPQTFDGTLISESLLSLPEQRCLIGEEYDFKDLNFRGKVLDAVVMKETKEVLYIVRSSSGQNHTLRYKMSDIQFDEYKAHADVYFGVHKKAENKVKDAVELFEVCRQQTSKAKREDLIALLKSQFRYDAPSELSDEELRDAYAEFQVALINAETKVFQQPSPQPDQKKVAKG